MLFFFLCRFFAAVASVASVRSEGRGAWNSDRTSPGRPWPWHLVASCDRPTRCGRFLGDVFHDVFHEISRDTVENSRDLWMWEIYGLCLVRS